MKKFVLSLDQGTTSSRALLFDQQLNILAQHQIPIKQIYPQTGWVEHDPIEIWQTTLRAAQTAIDEAKINPNDILSIGITNQRETTVLWDNETGTPLSNAIVWQDRRTSKFCQMLKDEGHEPKINARTGLLLDPYFSGTKLKWLLDNVEGAKERAQEGSLCFGTIDSWLLWNLTGGKVHKTDATNASRTMLYNIVDGKWDQELLDLFDIPASLLPEVTDCTGNFGSTDQELFGAKIQISAMAGDQHAALVGQACFQTGSIKSTYGTGCFVLKNIGETIIHSKSSLLTTIAYQLNGTPTYALEGSIFIAGAGVQWLRDEVELIKEASDCDDLARNSNLDDPVCLVPAFAGLGAPYWNADVRGALLNLTRGTGKAEIVRATLEAVGLQTNDLLEAMKNDQLSKGQGEELSTKTLRVDGGLTHSDWTMQFLADILNYKIEVSQNPEATALGVAYLAGMHDKLYKGFEHFEKQWNSSKHYKPKKSSEWREEKLSTWRKAIGSLVQI